MSIFDAEWYVIGTDGKQYGPYSRDQLVAFKREGKVGIETPIWSSSMGEWQSYGLIIENINPASIPGFPSRSSEAYKMTFSYRNQVIFWALLVLAILVGSTVIGRKKTLGGDIQEITSTPASHNLPSSSQNDSAALTVLQSDLFPFQDKMTGKYGYMNEYGQVKINATFFKADYFSDGIAIVGKDISINPYGFATDGGDTYINSAGIEILKTLKAERFSDGFGLVTQNEGKYFVNADGDVVSQKFQGAKSFSEGYAVVWQQDGVHVINKKFQSVAIILTNLSDDDKYFGTFHNGLMPIKDIHGKWGYVSPSGEIVITPKYRFAGMFQSGFAFVKDEKGKHILINRNDEEVYAFPEFDTFSSISKDLEKQFFISHSKLIFSRKSGSVYIVDLNTNATNKISVKDRSDENAVWVAPLALGDNIFYAGTALNFNGEIVWEIKNYNAWGANVIYGKFLETYTTNREFNDITNFYSVSGTLIEQQ